jgi:HAD superfamily hydrolase (TIGR01509 family)
MIAPDSVDLVIFDCDGVLVNSEEIACAVCVEALATLGMHMTMPEFAARHSGMPIKDSWALIEKNYGRPLPEGFREGVDREVHRRFAQELAPIDGVVSLLEALTLARCVASSTGLQRLTDNLRQVGLARFFEPSIFSVSQVRRGKPAPDVFLYAASQMGADPDRTLVVEDSQHGVVAARRAGMRVIGFAGGGHASHDHEERLTRAGAFAVAHSMAELGARLRKA